MIDKPFAYHKPSEDGLDKITKLRVAFSDLKARIEQVCPPFKGTICCPHRTGNISYVVS